MMKNIYTLFFLVLFTVQISIAQNAPDFKITDTKDKIHNLYADYLDQGKTVVLDLFFVDCPPCNDLAPLMEPLYQNWGAGQHDVEFFSISNRDDDNYIDGFKAQHNNSFPAAGTEGGGPDVDSPYSSGQFGQFFGYPTLIVISPDRSVEFDIWSTVSFAETISMLDEAITNTGATKPVTSSFQALDDVTLANVFPNPVVQTATLDLSLSNTIDAQIIVLNAVGETVANVHNGIVAAGRSQFTIDMSNQANGNYFVNIISDEGKSKSLPIIKVD